MSALPDVHDAHAVRMDRMYRYQRHIYDLTRKYYLLGRDRAIRELKPEPHQTILELGCGTGRNLALASRLYPQARLNGLDISEEMLMSARAQLPGGATLVAGDASNFSSTAFGHQGFDRILISYALSMIPDWERCIEQAVTALAPRGRLEIVDFGQQEDLPGWFRALLRQWLHRFHVEPRENLAHVAQEIAARHGAMCDFRPLYKGYAWSISITRGDR